MMGQDNITWTGARAPGVEQHRLLAWRCSTEQVISGTERKNSCCCGEHEGRRQTLTEAGSGKAPSERPAWKAVPRENPPYGILGGRWKRRHHSKSATRHRPTRPKPMMYGGGKSDPGIV